MLYSKLFVVAATFTGFVAAQGLNDTCCGVDPNSVDSDDRIAWCRAQTNTCPEICNGRTSSNTCNQQTLTFNCECQGSSTPNISDYLQTLPSLQCDEWKRQCVAAHPNDRPGQNICLSVTCGERNATEEAASSGGSTSGASSSSGSSASASQTGAASTGSSGTSPTESAAAATSPAAGAAAALALAQNYGTGIFAVGVLAFFGLAL